MTGKPSDSSADFRIAHISLDEETIIWRNADIEQERRIAIFDLLEENSFEVEDKDEGPYSLKLSMQERKLVFEIKTEAGDPVHAFLLSMTPFRGVIRDYFMICESYYEAIKSATPSRIEAVDMGRRGIHNEGAQILTNRLDGKINIDVDTSRRLFTLICVLHWQG